MAAGCLSRLHSSGLVSTMDTRNRRGFLRRLAAGAVATSASAKTIQARTRGNSLANSDPNERQRLVQQMREKAAQYEGAQSASLHPDNGDETGLPNYIGNFTKGLDHTQLGEVKPGVYETLLKALSTGKQSDFEQISRGSGAKFVNPQAAFCYQMQGADSQRLG